VLLYTQDEIMTTTMPREVKTTGGSCSPPRATEHRSRLPRSSILLGALSIALFWVFGVGFALGLGAVSCGVLAPLRSDLIDDEAASLWALLGVVAGVGGIIASTITLAPTLVQL
jgi:hypothetical protein